MGMAVPANSPYSNVRDIIKAAKSGKVLNVGSSGFGTRRTWPWCCSSA